MPYEGTGRVFLAGLTVPTCGMNQASALPSSPWRAGVWAVPQGGWDVSAPSVPRGAQLWFRLSAARMSLLPCLGV